MQKELKSNMTWIKNYQLFLFDFDGLLVNTEEIHFLAYRRMCEGRGFSLDWSFERYCKSAHYSADALQHDVYNTFPELKALEPSWDILYAEKKKAIMQLLSEGAVRLMPGVEELLTELAALNVKRCVVTHSADDLVSIVRKKNPVLDTIPFWITRRDYSHPKPHSECYLKAIKDHQLEGERVIGFEDTPRGMQALMGTDAQAVIICTAEYPEIPSFIRHGALHFNSFEDVAL